MIFNELLYTFVMYNGNANLKLKETFDGYFQLYQNSFFYSKPVYKPRTTAQSHTIQHIIYVSRSSFFCEN